jgi:catechol 2,3-dioxygenase-like lactoylglutathione lyase family enzyme
VDLNHLHLHVSDQARSRSFYERWFGFRERVCHGDILFLASPEGFDLALAPGDPGAFPAWFHFGFRLPASEDVRDLHGRMAAAHVAGLRDLAEEDDFVSFRLRDPDGHSIEVYWEPPTPPKR